MTDQMPEPYWGLWERTLLETYEGELTHTDRATRVFWLQTPLWHADLRVPADRPGFAGVKTLADCTDAQLRFIAGQEGFAGTTAVDGDICTWTRVHDLNPLGLGDVGRMAFETTDFLIEWGVEAAYLEHWVRKVAPGNAPPAATPDTLPDGALWLQVGDAAILTRPRSGADRPELMSRALDTLGRDDLLWRASLEFTLYRLEGVRWQASLSTHPWIEGTCL